jgi:CheY-like chemotaxis protein
MKLPPGRGETILIVDDDDLVRPSAVSLIESLGYRVLSAGNGHDALEILRQNTRVDLLFTDLFMPGGLHGPQLVAEARRLRPELKVLYTSGYLNYSVLRRGLDPGIQKVSSRIGRTSSRPNCARSSTVTPPLPGTNELPRSS